MEQITALLESKKYAPLDGTSKNTMKLLLENTEKEYNRLVNEGTLSGDVAQFTPILLPLVRRVYPTLIANELVGVQPMTAPTGFIYALVNMYTGDGNTTVNKQNLKIIKTKDNVSAISIYSEGDLHVVPKNADLTGITVQATYSNEAAFGVILKNYTGPYTTAQAEVLGKDMREVGFIISRKSVEAKARSLKAQYTVEMYQDLKAQHGLLADEELMSLMSYEIQAEIDREVVDFVNSNATQLPDTVVNTTAGRWDIEKMRAHVVRISAEAAQVGIDTKRGKANVLLVSPKVMTMLEQVGSFKIAEVANDAVQPVSGGVAGMFDGQYKVVVDQYAVSDYATVLYKGVNRQDAMGFFAPYVPLSFTKVVNAETGQPAIIAKTRYALETTPGIESPTSNDRASKYARSFGIDFSGTVLG